jgi:hypothetical protein
MIILYKKLKHMEHIFMESESNSNIAHTMNYRNNSQIRVN